MALSLARAPAATSRYALNLIDSAAREQNARAAKEKERQFFSSLEIGVDGRKQKRAALLLFASSAFGTGVASSLLSRAFSPPFFFTFSFTPASKKGSELTRLIIKTNKNSGTSSVSARPSAAAPRAPLAPRRSNNFAGRRAPLLLVARAEDEKKEGGGGDFYNDERPVSFLLLFFLFFSPRAF